MTELERIERLEHTVGQIARILSRLAWGDAESRDLLKEIANELSPGSASDVEKKS